MKRLGLFALLLVLLLVMAIPGPAGATVTGSAVFECIVKLPRWPAVGTPGPPVDCKGTGVGAVEGKTTLNKNYALVAAALNNFNGHANKYSETCTFNEPLNGKADGKTTIKKLKGTPAGSATATNNFVWTRIGSTAVIQLSAGLITWPNGTKATGSRGTAVAAFVPASAPGTCTAPKKLTAVIVGVALFQN